MEVSVISTESIKPWWLAGGSSEHVLKPFKLCLLDQLMTSTYSPLILFYPINDHHHHHHRHDEKLVGRQLKESLSKTLKPFYPVAGRVRDNLIIDDFGQGVPFTETRVNGHLSDLLVSPLHGGPELEFLNNLLPFEPFCYQDDAAASPQLAVQLNTFDCGGIALGLSMNHKLMDGVTASSFFHAWAANCDCGTTTTRLKKKQPPEFCKPSSVFHPCKSIPAEHHAYVKDRYFQGCRQKQKGASRRFVFDSNAIATLRARARSSRVMDPTRLEALSAFIWASALTADRRLQYFSQAVNLRPLMSPRLSKYSIGNLLTNTMASCKDLPSDRKSSMRELVGLIRDEAARTRERYMDACFDSERWYMAKLEGEKALREISGGCGGQILNCSSWIGFGTNSFDFGWGKPVWSGLFGNPSGNHAYLNNNIFFKELAGRGCEGYNITIEAWVRLDEDVMAALERDPHFIQYASPNPPIVLNL